MLRVTLFQNIYKLTLLVAEFPNMLILYALKHAVLCVEPHNLIQPLIRWTNFNLKCPKGIGCTKEHPFQ